MLLGTLVLANLKMIFRNRQALFWALFFPLIFVVVFGLFRLDEPPTTTIAIIDRSQDDLSRELVRSLSQIETFNVYEHPDEEKARDELREGTLRYLLILPEGLARSVAANSPVAVNFIYDEGTPTSAVVIGVVQRFLDKANMELVKVDPLLKLDARGVSARHLSYFDFLLPGFVGMGVMTYSVIGLASVMAVYREQKILKRILATPLRVRTFFAAVILAHLALSLAQAAIILAAGVFLFGGTIYGNYLYIALLVLLGNIIFLNLGFIVGTIAKNVNAASGLGNAVTVPMMFFSGVFFPTENLPRFLATVVTYLPLTPMLDAMRGVALDAMPLWEFPMELGLLGAWIVVTSVVAVRIFKFS
ncbi:MAG: ABC transporter permease [Chloroflexi bacterium]|nr:ABC transporter permease [Chloroflexota bacterium]